MTPEKQQKANEAYLKSLDEMVQKINKAGNKFNDAVKKVFEEKRKAQKK